MPDDIEELGRQDGSEAPGNQETSEVEEDLLEELTPGGDEKDDQELEKGKADFFSEDPVELDEPANEDTITDSDNQAETDDETDIEPEETVKLEEDEGANKTYEKNGKGQEQDKADRSGAETVKDESEQVSGNKAAKKSSSRRNSLLLVLIVFGIFVVGLGYLLGVRFGQNKEALHAEERIPTVSDPMVEAKLASFFVPLDSKTSEALMVKIDISVSWRRITGIRFKESQHDVRAEVYHVLEGVVGKAGNPKKDEAIIRQATAKALNNALGVSNIRITNIEMEMI